MDYNVDDARADAEALEHARNYARRGLGAQPSSQVVQYQPQQAGGSSTAKVLIVVAGLVAVAWMWFRWRKRKE